MIPSNSFLILWKLLTIVDYSIAHLSLIPVRSDANDRAEMVTQLLFGETYRIEETRDKWCRIIADYDEYEGWIDRRQCVPIDQKAYKKMTESDPSFTLDLLHSAINDTEHIPLVPASTLPGYDGLNFKLGKRKFLYNGQVFDPNTKTDRSLLAVKLALKYLNAPYQWGGRSPLGIDCSGLSQNIYKILGIPLKRDAYQQVSSGKAVDFAEQAENGDLAFFHNDEGKVTHVGIVYAKGDSKEIIHASGKVRIDALDNHGIFDRTEKKYTHKLKIIKRLLD